MIEEPDSEPESDPEPEEPQEDAFQSAPREKRKKKKKKKLRPVEKKVEVVRAKTPEVAPEPEPEPEPEVESEPEPEPERPGRNKVPVFEKVAAKPKRKIRTRKSFTRATQESSSESSDDDLDCDQAAADAFSILGVEKRRRYNKVFQSIDENGDGTLSLAELESSLASVNKAWSSGNANGKADKEKKRRSSSSSSPRPDSSGTAHSIADKGGNDGESSGAKRAASSAAVADGGGKGDGSDNSESQFIETLLGVQKDAAETGLDFKTFCIIVALSEQSEGLEEIFDGVEFGGKCGVVV